MDQEQLLEAIKNPTSENAKAAATALKKLAQPIYQAVFNTGHSEATEKAKTTEKELTEKLEAEQERASKAEKKAKDLEAGAPDVAKVTEQFEQQITELKEKHKAEKKALEQKAQDAALEIHRAKAVDKLVEQGVNRTYAEVLMEREANRNRLKLDKDGKLQILQAGKDIPIVVDAEQSPLDVFTAELAGATPAELKTSNGDRGAGSTSATTGSGSTGYDPVKDGQARAQAQAGSEQNRKLAFS